MTDVCACQTCGQAVKEEATVTERDRLAAEACPMCGRRPNQRLRERLAAPAPLTLDVERLAEAIRRWWGQPLREHLPASGTYTVDIEAKVAARYIAAEYAALAPQAPDEQAAP